MVVAAIEVIDVADVVDEEVFLEVEVDAERLLLRSMSTIKSRSPHFLDVPQLKICQSLSSSIYRLICFPLMICFPALRSTMKAKSGCDFSCTIFKNRSS